MSLRSGFALPTVMITSVVMLGVLLAGLVYASSTNVTVRDQYYDQLAREAAESGINFIVSCLRQSITPSGTYTPKSKSCGDASADSSKSEFLLDTSSDTNARPTVKTTYSTSTSAISNDGYYTITATGSAQIFRTSNTTTPWRTITKPVNMHIQAQTLFPAKTVSGNSFVCSILTGNIWCWGINNNAEHGDGTSGGGNDPSKAARIAEEGHTTISYTVGSGPGSLKTFSRNLLAADIDVSAGTGFACGISTNRPPSSYGGSQTSYSTNVAYCWGSQDNGELGNGVNSTALEKFPTVVNPQWLGSTTAAYPVQVAVGKNHACVRTTTPADGKGTVWCWGLNTKGQMGVGTTTSPQLTPKRVYNPAGGDPAGVPMKYIQSGETTMCGIRSNDVALCWGNNDYGQTGTNSSGNNILLPTQVVVAVSGNPTLSVSDISVSDRQITDADGGPTGHGCAISTGASSASGDRAGLIYCWGDRVDGATGLSITSGYATRANALTISDYPNYYAESISSSWRTSCALVRQSVSADSSTRRIYCWGNNTNGELGVYRPPTSNADGRTVLAKTNTPQRIYITSDTSSPDYFEEKDVTWLNAGGVSYRFCAIAGTHNYCWGRNNKGQVGDGTTDGDFSTQTSQNARFYPRLSIFSDPPQVGITY